MNKLTAVLAVMLLLVSCGTEETVVLMERPDYAEYGKCPYTWQEGDGWEFIAWALDLEGGAETLAIQSGYEPGRRPETGESIELPFPEELHQSLENRLESARLVREATGKLEEGDTTAVRSLLEEAISADPSWSVPAFDLSLILLRQEGPQAALMQIQPIAHKYDAALLQSSIAWERGDTQEAMRQLEICLMEESPPFEVMAAAALIYTVTGNYYQASNIWRQILSSPEAAPSVRVMAAQYALLHAERMESDRD
ncbi:MAG: hypothetical protein GF388_10850 [Candidatus Aegiribacteria sp.]|nr:hypothetical protein [Candidatus Aegiribacteria sp.]MBD3295508.1 hypothetical protein [Candidatus Fermentibacteria bacterium]